MFLKKTNRIEWHAALSVESLESREVVSSLLPAGQLSDLGSRPALLGQATSPAPIRILPYLQPGPGN